MIFQCQQKQQQKQLNQHCIVCRKNQGRNEASEMNDKQTKEKP